MRNKKIKLKTLVKLLMAKERQPDIILHVENHEYDLKVYDYIFYKNTKVLDWTYITDALDNAKDQVVIYI